MRTMRIPLIVFVALWLGFIAWVNWTSGALPQTVPSHFNAAGVPDGWMNKSAYLVFIQVLGLCLPLAIPVVGGLCTLLPDWMINLPHKDYWLAPERRTETRFYIIRQSLWVSCLILLLIAGAHQLTVTASHTQPAHLPMQFFWPLLAGFVVAILVWLVVFLRHFSRP